jgi:hypothetical protein
MVPFKNLDISFPAFSKKVLSYTINYMRVSGQSMTMNFGIYEEAAFMKVSQDYEDFHQKVRPALKSKQEEFLILGYDNVSQDDIWIFLQKKKWRKETHEMKLYEVVQSILSLKVGELINYMTVESLKEADFTFENEEERLKLLE